MDEDKIGINDIAGIVLLSRKYKEALGDSFSESKNDRILDAIIDSNNSCLEVMKNCQELLLTSIKLKDKDEEMYEDLLECKKIFDGCLKTMSELSDVLEITIVPKPDEEESWGRV